LQANPHIFPINAEVASLLVIILLFFKINLNQNKNKGKFFFKKKNIRGGRPAQRGWLATLV
jgi:hypothetical protein